MSQVEKIRCGREVKERRRVKVGFECLKEVLGQVDSQELSDIGHFNYKAIQI